MEQQAPERKGEGADLARHRRLHDHLFHGGAKIHIERAISEGASEQEILAIFAITSQLGLQTYQIGILILKAALEKRDGAVPPAEGAASNAELKERFVSSMGYWDGWWGDLLEISPETFEATLRYASFPWESGAVEPKVKALIWLAVNSSTTHLFEPGIKLGIDLALKYGAAPRARRSSGRCSSPPCSAFTRSACRCRS